MMNSKRVELETSTTMLGRAARFWLLLSLIAGCTVQCGGEGNSLAVRLAHDPVGFWVVRHELRLPNEDQFGESLLRSYPLLDPVAPLGVLVAALDGVYWHPITEPPAPGEDLGAPLLALRDGLPLSADRSQDVIAFRRAVGELARRLGDAAQGAGLLVLLDTRLPSMSVTLLGMSLPGAGIAQRTINLGVLRHGNGDHPLAMMTMDVDRLLGIDGIFRELSLDHPRSGPNKHGQNMPHGGWPISVILDDGWQLSGRVEVQEEKTALEARDLLQVHHFGLSRCAAGLPPDRSVPPLFVVLVAFDREGKFVSISERREALRPGEMEFLACLDKLLRGGQLATVRFDNEAMVSLSGDVARAPVR